MSILEKSPEIRYLTHMVVFPDGDALVEQKPFIHDLMFEMDNWEHLPPFNDPSCDTRDCMRSLLKKGEYKFETPTAEYGALTHVLTIENQERKCGWFGSTKEGFNG